jgi:hypothetical protein
MMNALPATAAVEKQLVGVRAELADLVVRRLEKDFSPTQRNRYYALANYERALLEMKKRRGSAADYKRTRLADLLIRLKARLSHPSGSYS